MFGLYVYRRAFAGRVLASLLPGAGVGVTVGWATARLVPEAAVTLLVGAIGLVFALSLLLRRPAGGAPKRAKVGPGLFWGVLTGFTSFVSHAGAPPYQVYVQPLGLTRTVFAGTATIAFAVINLLKLWPYHALGQLGAGNLQVAMVLAVPAALAVFLGARLVERIPERRFFQAVTWALLLISGKLVWDGGTGLV